MVKENPSPGDLAFDGFEEDVPRTGRVNSVRHKRLSMDVLP
jgi:hypothetical protein